MTPARFKTKYLRYLYIGMALLFFILLIPVYMYFSHDVAQLDKKYPHVLDPKSKTPEFELKEGRPKGWVKLAEISHYAKGAIIVSEDWDFYHHDGIDLAQIKVALNEMVEVKRFRGASTITQQMVKNVFLPNHITVLRKIHEIFLAQKVEEALSKKRILEVYLNVIEFGPGIYGINKASYHYFKKHPSEITPREGAFLAMLLPSPKRYYVSFKKKRLTPFARKRVHTILRKMRMGKYISPEEYEREMASFMDWEDPL